MWVTFLMQALEHSSTDTKILFKQSCADTWKLLVSAECRFAVLTDTPLPHQILFIYVSISVGCCVPLMTLLRCEHDLYMETVSLWQHYYAVSMTCTLKLSALQVYSHHHDFVSFSNCEYTSGKSTEQKRIGLCVICSASTLAPVCPISSPHCHRKREHTKKMLWFTKEIFSSWNYNSQHWTEHSYNEENAQRK